MFTVKIFFVSFIGEGVAGNTLYIKIYFRYVVIYIALIICHEPISDYEKIIDYLMYLAARPSYRPYPVTATVGIDNSDNISGKMKAKCTFPDNIQNPGVLLYQVSWLFDNVFGYTTETVSYDDINKTDIILDETNIKTLGRTVILYFVDFCSNILFG